MEPPRSLRLRLNEANVLMSVEGQNEKQTVGGVSAQRDYLYVDPSVGLDLRGSVYHPNQLDFVLQPQLGPSWQTVSLDPPGGVEEDTRFLQRYHVSADLYRRQPFATHVFADHDVTYRDFDFFTRARVDSERYGGNAGYVGGPLPFTVSILDVDEDVTGASRDTALAETTVTLNARNPRSKTGHTDLSYVLDDFTRREEGLPTVSGVNHTANLLDRQVFGRGERAKLNSTVLFHRLDDSTMATRDLGVHENLDWEHTKDLTSIYDYAFDNRTSGTTTSQSHSATASLRHQLYRNLTSVPDIHGSQLNTSSPGSTFESTRYGTGLHETYTKRLGRWGQLTLSDGIRLDHEDRETTGPVRVVLEEQHALTDGVVTYLDQPNVLLMTVRVTDLTGTIVFANGLDFVLFSGVRTQIQRVLGGTIPNGSRVLVNYTAAGQQSGSFDTLENQFSFRLEFARGLLGLYCRVGYLQNYGGEDLVLQNFTDFVAGADTTWRWLHAGVEYEDFDSNLTPFAGARAYEDFEFPLTGASLLSLNLSQSWTTFPDVNERQRSFDFIGRYRLRLGSRLAATAEGGLRHVRGHGQDQDLATARLKLEFTYAQLSINAGYEFEDNDYLGQLRERHYFFFRLKRTF